MNEAHIFRSETHQIATPRVWDTKSVRDEEAFDFYREAICAAFMPLRPELRKRQRQLFHAEVKSHQLDDGVLNRVTALSHSVHKGRTEIAASWQDCFYLNLQRAGICRVEQGGSDIVLRPGEIGIFDGAAVFDLDHGRCRTLAVDSLLIPKAMLQGRFESLPSGIPIKLSQHQVFGPLLCESVRSLASAVDYEARDEMSELYNLVLYLASKALDTSGHRPPEPMRRDANFRRITHLIRLNCTDESYSIEGCAAAVGLSVGYIRNLFTENEDSFGRYLLRERLRRAAEILSHPFYAHLPAYSVAHLAGFKDPSHFSRAFRQRYHCSPLDWRRQS